MTVWGPYLTRAASEAACSSTLKVADLQKVMQRFKELPTLPKLIIDKRGRVWESPNVPSQVSLEDAIRRNGGYVIHRDFVKGLYKIKAYWDRRNRKKQRRYQHQKRKQ